MNLSGAPWITHFSDLAARLIKGLPMSAARNYSRAFVPSPYKSLVPWQRPCLTIGEFLAARKLAKLSSNLSSTASWEKVRRIKSTTFRRSILLPKLSRTPSFLRLSRPRTTPLSGARRRRSSLLGGAIANRDRRRAQANSRTRSFYG